MRRIALLFVVSIFCICAPSETILAREVQYVGQELNGTWQVVKNDIPFEGADEVFLPIGQKVAFWLTGDSHGYSPLQRPRTGMDIGMKLILPIDKSVCKLSAWNYLCDKNENLKLDGDNIKNDAYVVTDADDGLLNKEFMGTKELAVIKKNWSKNIKNYFYHLNMNDESRSYDIYPMKNGNEILVFSSWTGVIQFPALLRRVK